MSYVFPFLNSLSFISTSNFNPIMMSFVLVKSFGFNMNKCFFPFCKNLCLVSLGEQLFTIRTNCFICLEQFLFCHYLGHSLLSKIPVYFPSCSQRYHKRSEISALFFFFEKISNITSELHFCLKKSQFYNVKILTLRIQICVFLLCYRIMLEDVKVIEEKHMHAGFSRQNGILFLILGHTQ